jgi:para-nitrobenzyl esterase
VEVRTGAGAVAGQRLGDLCVFRSIPYARPPLGPLRFEPPQAAEPWSGALDATRFRASAMQSAPAGPAAEIVRFEPLPTSEDCLQLHVWTPAADGARRPVLVWLHGGAYVIGSGAQAAYDGARLAARGDVVVVTVNYRLGSFGWLRGRERCGAALPTSGHAGLLDQIAALRWVRREIAAFGGDPACVTAFGESAGSTCISLLLAGANPRELFDRAILQSGAPNLTQSLGEAAATAGRVLDAVGLEPADAARLRSLPAADLLAAQDRGTPRGAGVFYRPARDGEQVPLDAFAEIARGSAAGVPVLVGSNRDEMKFFSGRDPRLAALDLPDLHKWIEALVAQRFPRAAGAGARVVETYAAARRARGESVAPAELLHAINADLTFRHPALRLAELQSRHAPVYAYLFEHASPIHGGAIGAGHVLEIPFVFGTYQDPTLRDYAGDEPHVPALSRAMQDAWLAFARSGDPSQPELRWPRYDARSRTTLRFGPNSRADDAPLEPERAIWDSLGGA